MSIIDVQYQTPPCSGGCFKNSATAHFDNQEKERSKTTEHLDDVLVQAMKHLSFDELQREQEELHGVNAGRSNEDLAVDGLLVELENHLNRLKPGTKFETAQLMNPEYDSRRDFRLIFLAGNRYDAKAAAEQMIRHFEMKSELFGINKLTKDITLDDLDQDDIDSLLSGSMQFSKLKDRSGRLVVLELPGLRRYKSLINELRSRFYLYMELLKHVEDPSKGSCYISYSVDQFMDAKNGAGFIENTRLALTIPINCCGMHLCISDRAEAIITKAAIAIMPARLRAKTKVHFGSHTECQYHLSTFGINRMSLPLFYRNNDVCMDDHMAWYHQQLSALNATNSVATHPAAAAALNTTIEPTHCDVVFNGRTTNGGGNERLRQLTLHYAPAYDTDNVDEKRRIVTSMMENVQNTGGRFLKWHEETQQWKEVPQVEVREKVCQMFRNLRRRAAQQQKQEATPMQFVNDICPNDVLFGRRKEHPGNLRLKILVESLAAEYDAATRGRKKQLTALVIQEIEQTGGRFLEKVNGDSWVLLSRQALGDKLSSQFRNYRRRVKEKALVK